MSHEEARQQLADLNVEYSQESFTEYAGRGDDLVVDLFLKASMDPNAQARAKISVEEPWGNWGVQRGLKQLIKEETPDGTLILEGASPLMMAAMRGHNEVVRRLLEAGADSTAKTSLLEAGANPTAGNDRDGTTALICAM